MSDTGADEALALAHRQSFGRLVGWLFRMTGDLQLSEDAVASAFASAVSSWRAAGVPDSPVAWLRVAARNQAMTALRRASRAISVAPEIFDEYENEVVVSDAVDDRLALLFVCAHPAIDSRMHAPLMLQSVLGVDAARIAPMYLVPATTMGQRLSRAKAKIRDSGIRYRLPESDELPGRVGAVLQAVYAAYGLSDPTADTANARDDALRTEALRLAGLLTELWGLQALLLHTQSRRAGRIVNGEFVPLGQQDTSRWSAESRRAGDDSLRRASALGVPGRFQLEAAISAIHSSRADDLPADWESIVLLYRGLLGLAPSVGATIGAASALLELGEIDESTQLLDGLPTEAVRDHQPYWVGRARLMQARGDTAQSRAAAVRAIGLTSDPAVRSYLIRTIGMH